MRLAVLGEVGRWVGYGRQRAIGLSFPAGVPWVQEEVGELVDEETTGVQGVHGCQVCEPLIAAEATLFAYEGFEIRHW